MIQTKELKTKEDFENLKKGDIIACNVIGLGVSATLHEL
jgi:hypothetical protein